MIHRRLGALPTVLAQLDLDQRIAVLDSQKRIPDNLRDIHLDPQRPG